LKANLHRAKDLQSKGNNVQRGLNVHKGKAYVRKEREQVRKQTMKKYTTLNIYTNAKMYSRTRQKMCGGIQCTALESKCASKQGRCTRIKSRSTMRQKWSASTNRRCKSRQRR
jgi:hypothetical protein